MAMIVHISMPYYSFFPTCHHISTVEQKSSFPSIGRDFLLPVVAAEHRPHSPGEASQRDGCFRPAARITGSGPGMLAVVL